MGVYRDVLDVFRALKSPKKRTDRGRDVSVTIGKRSAFEASDVNNLLGGWDSFSKPINSEIEAELRSLRARSRQLAKNNPYLRRFYQLCRSNIIGPVGFVFRSDVNRETGKDAGKADKLARTAIEKGWKEFNKRGVMCALDRYTGLEIQNLSSDQVMRDGELILMQINDPNKFGVSFKFIDPELMDVNHKMVSKGGNRVRMGIETNKVGKVVAYHFHSTDTTHESYYASGGKGFLRIDKRFIIHRFVTEYVDQLRGFPHSTATMVRLKMLGGYEDAELVQMRQGATAMGFIERGEGGKGFEGENYDDDEDSEGDTDESYPEIEAEPGRFHYIANGAKVHTWNPTSPTTAYKDYIKALLRGVASGLGVDYNTLANDLEGVNYSSLRGGVLESRELWKTFQEWMIEHVMDELFERWLTSALLRGVLKFPNGQALRSSDLERFSAHHFQGRRWAWVDPLKDIQAGVIQINEGLRSRSSLIREQGADPDQVWDEIAAENELLAERNISIKPTTESQLKVLDDEGQDEESEEESPESDEES